METLLNDIGVGEKECRNRHSIYFRIEVGHVAKNGVRRTRGSPEQSLSAPGPPCMLMGMAKPVTRPSEEG